MYFRTIRTPSQTDAVMLFPKPNPFRDLLPHHSLGWRACKITEHDEEKGTYGVEFKNGELKNGVIMGLLREPLGKVLIGRKPLVFDVGDSKIDAKLHTQILQS